MAAAGGFQGGGKLMFKNYSWELFNDEDTPPEKRAVVHTLRHSVATQQVRKGVPIEVISKTLDHSSINVTSQIYAKIAPELIKQATSDLWN